MVESLKELNRICQKPRYREVGNWMVRRLLRDAALPVTWLLLHTPVTANQVTLVSLMIGLFGISLLALPSSFLFLMGTVFLQLWYFLDHVDGQIARYRKTACLSGRFFDFMTHHLIHGTLFFSLGVYGYFQTQQFLLILWGFMGSISILMFNLTQDTKYKTFYEGLEGKERIACLKASPTGPSNLSAGPGGLRKIFSFLHKSSEIHVMMNLLTAAALFQFIFKGGTDLRLYFLVYYGLVFPFLGISKVYYLISRRKIDQEFSATFQFED